MTVNKFGGNYSLSLESLHLFQFPVMQSYLYFSVFHQNRNFAVILARFQGKDGHQHTCILDPLFTIN